MMVCLIMNKKQSVFTILVLMFLLIVSNILYLYISKRHTTNQAVRVYNEFIEGRRCNGGESILSYATPTREPEKGMPRIIVWQIQQETDTRAASAYIPGIRHIYL